MKQVFEGHRLCKLDGPLGPYIDSYEAEMRSCGYAQQTREVQTRSPAATLLVTLCSPSSKIYDQSYAGLSRGRTGSASTLTGLSPISTCSTRNSPEPGIVHLFRGRNSRHTYGTRLGEAGADAFTIMASWATRP
jgi:hypothetical protein